MQVKYDDSAIRKVFADAPVLMRKATKSALVNLLKRMQPDLEAALVKSIDRPVPFTAGQGQAWYVRYPFKETDQMMATIGIRGRQASYLQFMIKGIPRDRKIIERKTPDGRILTPSKYVTLDKYGNVPRDQYLRMFRAAFAGNARSEYFFLPTQRGRMAPGIYKRTGAEGEDGRRKPIPMYFAHNTAQNFGKRFDFFGIAEQSFNKHWKESVDEAIAVRLAKMK